MINKEIRIQKLISNYGANSRREAEHFIKKGLVTKNGHKVTLGDKGTINDLIEINGKKINFNTKYDYFLLNKPKGYISKRVDEQHKEVISLIPNINNRNLFTVGRLDVQTTGLIIITNDGYLSNVISSPKNKIKKTYLVFVEGKINHKMQKQIKMGIELDDGYVTKPTLGFKVIKETDDQSTYKISISEGKKNQIRRMMIAAGTKVINLKRISIGNLTIEGINIGKYKKLGKQEIYDHLGIEMEK